MAEMEINVTSKLSQKTEPHQLHRSFNQSTPAGLHEKVKYEIKCRQTGFPRHEEGHFHCWR